MLKDKNRYNKMVDYSQGKIYKIVNDKNNKIYIGSTVNPLYKRFGDHKKRAGRNDRNNELYKDMREFGKDCFKILLIKNYECKSKDELEAEEYKVIQEHKNNGCLLYNIKVEKDKHAESTCKRLSELFKGKTITEEIKQKLREAYTEERKKEQSERMKGENNPMFGTKLENENNPNFKYGCIYLIKRENRYVLSWKEEGKQKSKGFSYGFKSKRSQRTEAEALDECQKFRRTIYPDCEDEYLIL